ncbi:MAG: serine O-acetyltransferase [Oscillospiraceae bacterium]|nr:serine O-acetyltransferase [Oscillospiraceae bacterium]
MNEHIMAEIARVTQCIATQSEDTRALPCKATVAKCLDTLRHILFPEHFVREHLQHATLPARVEALLKELSFDLIGQIRLATRHHQNCETHQGGQVPPEAEVIAAAFFAQIPQIKARLTTDIEALYQGDPAAGSRCEVILSYPGLYAGMVYRIAHELHVLGVPILPRMMTEHAHSATGIDIHPGATVGAYFCMDHGTGIVIGESTVIGNHVKIYQGVTIGALSTKSGQGLKGTKRHPTIGDHVTIYAGATILGGDTVIGEHAVIGGNAFVVKSVPAHTSVRMKAPELQYKNDGV